MNTGILIYFIAHNFVIDRTRNGFSVYTYLMNRMGVTGLLHP